MFICGSTCCGHDDKNRSYISPNSPPKRSKKGKILRRLIGKGSTKKNPYAEVGLNKFHALLADLDDKKQKIYSQIGEEEISLVRFVFSGDSEQVRPIIVRVKNNNGNNNNVMACNHADVKMDGRKEIGDERKEKGTAEEAVLMKTRRRWKGRLRRSYYCNIGVVVVLILVFLAIFGRSVAILCTTIAWYSVPWIVGGGSSLSSTRKSMRNVG